MKILPSFGNDASKSHQAAKSDDDIARVNLTNFFFKFNFLKWFLSSLYLWSIVDNGKSLKLLIG
jgi:hypothetical protein